MQLQRLRLVMICLIGIMIVSVGITSAHTSQSDSSQLAYSAVQPAQLHPQTYTIAPLGVSASPNQLIVQELEPNNTPVSATLMPDNGLIEGTIYPAADVDFFAFHANAGDHIYAATMTSFSASSNDTLLELRAPDGTTILESDNDDGSFSALASSIAGTTILTTGIHYFRVSGTATGLVLPYRLYLQIQQGSPVAEIEPNNAIAQPLPANGWVSGVVSPVTDTDFFALDLNAGDSVFLSVDGDPERNGVTWNPRLGFGLFNGNILVVDDGSTVSPNSEAFFLTVKQNGTYFVRVNTNSATGAEFTYELSAKVIPAVARSACRTYTSTEVPQQLGPEPGRTRSTITIPDQERIASLAVSLQLTHTNMPDLDAVLTAPTGVTSNSVVLFTDVGASSQISMNLSLSDQAAIPVGLFTVMTGMEYTPESRYRLDWFKQQNSQGTWTLDIYDDLTANGGELLNWSITVCSEPPLTCPDGSSASVVYSTDFEADDGGFTHSGAQDEWEWGAPTFAPINTSYNGNNVWATDLDDTYNASSSQDLFSPVIDLQAVTGTIYLAWAQKHQIESTTFDNAFVNIQNAGGSNVTQLWRWLGPTMTESVGNPVIVLNESAGWSVYQDDISVYAGQQVQLHFHLGSDSSVNFAGLAIDDVTILACAAGSTPTTTPISGSVTPTTTPISGSVTPTTTPISSSVTPTTTPISSSVTPTTTPISSSVTPTTTPISSSVTPTTTPISSSVTPTTTPISSSVTPTTTPISSSVTPTTTPISGSVTPTAATSTPTAATSTPTAATSTPTVPPTNEYYVYLPVVLR